MKRTRNATGNWGRLAVWCGVALLALGSKALAQPTLERYLGERTKLGISAPVGLETALTTVGTRTFEVRASVRGSLVRDGKRSLLLELEDGEHVVAGVGADHQWLAGRTGAIRMILRTIRPNEASDPATDVHMAIDEGHMTTHELAQAQERAMEVARNRQRGSATSRGSVQRPPREQVEVAKDWSLGAHEATPYYAGYVKRQNSRLSDAEAYRIAEGIVGFSVRFGVDARLILAMVQVESGFDPSATSRSGAQGLGQLMPGTARGLGVSNSYDTNENLYGTVKLIRGHIANYMRKTGDAYESLVLALAAYNAGSGAVRRHGGVPPYRETQNYIPKVINLYRKLCEG